jgi:hypothetical protein
VEELPAHHREQSDIAACRRFWAAYASRQIDDYVALAKGDTIPTNGHAMTKEERGALRDELTEWLSSDAGDVGSLLYCCAVMGMSAASIRKRLSRRLGADIKILRRQLSLKQREQILVGFRRGVSSTIMAAKIGCDAGDVPQGEAARSSGPRWRKKKEDADMNEQWSVEWALSEEGRKQVERLELDGLRALAEQGFTDLGRHLPKVGKRPACKNICALCRFIEAARRHLDVELHVFLDDHNTKCDAEDNFDIRSVGNRSEARNRGDVDRGVLVRFHV